MIWGFPARHVGTPMAMDGLFQGPSDIDVGGSGVPPMLNLDGANLGTQWTEHEQS